MANYSDALEMQVRLIRFFAEEEGGWTEQTDREFARLSAYVLGRADTYYWDRPFCDLLTAAASALPDFTMSQEVLPSQSGFIWFAAPIPLPAGGMWPAGACRAFAWMGAPGGCFYVTLATEGTGDELKPRSYGNWKYGNSLNGDSVVMGAAGRVDADPAERITAALFASALLFLNQRILIAPRVRAERHARKRLEREGWTHEPLIRVVQLRRTERQSAHQADTHEARDYAYQWIVRGHWRQQACGEGHKERRPLWITPYVKGPEDKPLKAPRATVFAVTR